MTTEYESPLEYYVRHAKVLDIPLRALNSGCIPLKIWNNEDETECPPTHLTRIGYPSCERNGIYLRVELYGNMPTKQVHHFGFHKKPVTIEERRAQHLLGLRNFPWGTYEFGIFKTNEQGKSNGLIIKVSDNVIQEYDFFENNIGDASYNAVADFNKALPRLQTNNDYKPILNWMLEEYASACKTPVQ